VVFTCTIWWCFLLHPLLVPHSCFSSRMSCGCDRGVASWSSTRQTYNTWSAWFTWWAWYPRITRLTWTTGHNRGARWSCATCEGRRTDCARLIWCIYSRSTGGTIGAVCACSACCARRTRCTRYTCSPQTWGTRGPRHTGCHLCALRARGPASELLYRWKYTTNNTFNIFIQRTCRRHLHSGHGL